MIITCLMEHAISEKDIGLIIGDQLSFEKHISEKMNTADSVMDLIKRTFTFLDHSSLKFLYDSLVRLDTECIRQPGFEFIFKKAFLPCRKYATASH